MPGRRRLDCEFEGVAIGGGGFGCTADWLTTVLSWLGLPLKLRLSGCQVLRRQASSEALDVDSRRTDQAELDAVGEETKLLLVEKTPALELFMVPGPNMGRPGMAWGDWNGFAPDGTLSRRPGVRVPVEYMLCDRECVEEGEARPDHRGLLWPVEKVAEVGVLNSLGDAGRNEEYVLSALLRYDSRDTLARGSAAMTSGGGRRLASGWVL